MGSELMGIEAAADISSTFCLGCATRAFAAAGWVGYDVKTNNARIRHRCGVIIDHVIYFSVTIDYRETTDPTELLNVI